jgi:hypothetical protein
LSWVFQNENGQPIVIQATVVIKEKKKIEPILISATQPTSATSLITELKPPSFQY